VVGQPADLRRLHRDVVQEQVATRVGDDLPRLLDELAVDLIERLEAPQRRELDLALGLGEVAGGALGMARRLRKGGSPGRCGTRARLDGGASPVFCSPASGNVSGSIFMPSQVNLSHISRSCHPTPLGFDAPRKPCY